MLHPSLLAMASPQGGGGGSSAMLIQIMPIVLIFLVFWFMIIRPQKKQQEQRKAMLEALKRGDRILTNGGLYGTVRDIKGDIVVVNIAENVKVEVSRAAISAVLGEG